MNRTRALGKGRLERLSLVSSRERACKGREYLNACSVRINTHFLFLVFVIKEHKYVIVSMDNERLRVDFRPINNLTLILWRLADPGILWLLKYRSDLDQFSIWLWLERLVKLVWLIGLSYILGKEHDYTFICPNIVCLIDFIQGMQNIIPNKKLSILFCQSVSCKIVPLFHINNTV